MQQEIERFAGKELLTEVTTVHWGTATRQTMRALRAEGVRIVAGYFDPYGDSTGVSYYLPLAQWQYMKQRDYWKDTQENIIFVRHDIVLNQFKPADVVPQLERIAADPHQAEIMELMIHEQVRG